ncbi:MAG: recombination regulator RecX [Fusobacteria bacterium]|nr:recombination regulator RecX [Fusobacteriota bacterium]
MQKKKTAKEYCIYLLSRKDYAKKEIVGKLQEKSFSDEEIAEAMSFLEVEKYIDDEKYALIYFKYLIGRHKSLKEIEFKLKNKGFDQMLIRKILSDPGAKLLEKEGLIAKITSFNRKNQHKDKNQLISYFVRKGFSYSMVIESLDQYYEY